MDVPFFSIIVAVYNVAPYLKKCVGSILAQPVKNYEVILVDDGSTDGSAAICDAFAAGAGQVSVIHKENGGLSSARNAGLRRAAGTYILFVDGDDFIAPDSLGKIQKSIQKNIKRSIQDGGMPDVVFLEGRKIFIDGSTTALMESGISRAAAPMESGISSAICGLRQDQICAYLAALPKFPASACTKAVRRGMFAGGTLYFREHLLCEDLEWSPRLFLCMASAGYCSCDYYCYRQGRRGSISNTASEKKAMDVLSTVERWNRYAKKTGDRQKKQLVCSLMEYTFRHLLLNYSSVSRAHRRAYRRRVRKSAWILHTRKDAASRLIAYSYRLMGICLTGKMLKIYLRCRDRRTDNRNDTQKDSLLLVWRRGKAGIGHALHRILEKLLPGL